MTYDTMGCDRLDELLPEYLEEGLDAATRTEVEAHLASCQRCAPIVAELKAIAAAAAELPELSPSRDLWNGITERIAAPVISLPSERERRTVRSSRLRMAAAAAALVVMTATLTFIGTKQIMQRSGELGGNQIASVTPSTGMAGAQEFKAGPDSAAPRGTAANPSPATPIASEPPRSTDRTRLIREPDRTSVRRPGASNVARTAAERAYDREIDQLQELLTERRRELDPNTVQVIERNLRVIDDAIRQSREALQRDPASRFLNDQLNNALDKKVELLRSAAMLPSST